jgi:hypothetical protein
MPRKNLWNANVPRVELDQRVRDARLRLERIERLLVPRAAVTNSWLRRVFYLFRLGIYGNASQGNQTRGPLSDQRPSRLPKFIRSSPKCVVYSVPGQARANTPPLHEGCGEGKLCADAVPEKDASAGRVEAQRTKFDRPRLVRTLIAAWVICLSPRFYEHRWRSSRTITHAYFATCQFIGITL